MLRKKLLRYMETLRDRPQRDTTRSIVVIWVNIFQTELMIEIYSKSQVRAIGKVVLIKFR